MGCSSSKPELDSDSIYADRMKAGVEGLTISEELMIFSSSEEDDKAAAVDETKKLTHVPANSIDPVLLQAFIELAGDPDDVLPAWVSGATPLGIMHDIETRGIFPTVPVHQKLAPSRLCPIG